MTPNEAAKLKIRNWSAQLDHLKDKLKTKQITLEQYKELSKSYKIRIEAVQDVFKMALYS